jgi:hypothetical protein
MPTPQQLLLFVLHQSLDPTDLGAPETATISQPNLIKPELRSVLVALDVNVRRFFAVASIEEESVRTNPKYRRHAVSLSCLHWRKKTGE